MSEIVIQVESLSKFYRLGVVNTGTLSHDLSRWWARLRGKPDPTLRVDQVQKSVNNTPENNGENDYIWALKDIDFEVKQGEILGIIGRNGAGKSTLLKILSRVTAPTTGECRVKGRIASLLEVGTGFHPELSGRENIYLNGCILGMTKGEISRKFDEIVNFSGVEKYIDTPVKRYSSGMYVRLAFAVAAHLEPEILIIDEVLAVGDAEFQKKCLGKMGEVTQGGRTVLFVSHNMQSIRQICQRCIYLSAGEIVLDDVAKRTVDTYLQSIPMATSDQALEDVICNLPGDPAFQLKSISITQKGKPVNGRVLNGLSLDIRIDYKVLQPTIGLRVFFDLCDVESEILFRSFHDERGIGIPRMDAGEYSSKVNIPANILAPAKHQLVFHAGIHNVRWCIPYGGIRVPIVVEATGYKNTAYPRDSSWGKFALALEWKTFREKENSLQQCETTL